MTLRVCSWKPSWDEDDGREDRLSEVAELENGRPRPRPVYVEGLMDDAEDEEGVIVLKLASNVDREPRVLFKGDDECGCCGACCGRSSSCCCIAGCCSLVRIQPGRGGERSRGAGGARFFENNVRLDVSGESG